MRRQGQAGDAAVPLLGGVLLLLLLVGALGLAEGARATAMRTLAARTLAAALDSAARAASEDPAAADRAFQRVLKANLGAVPYRARLNVGSSTVTGRLELPYHLQYLAPFRGEVTLVIVQSATVPERKAAP